MAAAPNPTSKEFLRRFRKALSVPFLLNQVCSTNIQEFVGDLAGSLGVSEKCVFLPLLTCAGACLGTGAGVRLAPLWQEPPLLWTMVLCPRSLARTDAAEHLKQSMLRAQNRALVLGKSEDTKEYLKKFLFDEFSMDKLQDALKLAGGHGLALYSSCRPLHPALSTPAQAEAMARLHAGHAWFTDSRVGRMTLEKTRVSFAVVATPASAHAALTTTPNFQELFHQCFLVTCSEEAHVKFGQMSGGAEGEDKLTDVFVELLKLHSKEHIEYRFSEEGVEKFSQIHDELTDKARQMSRKSPHKVFQPALSCLVRIALALHALDAALDAINYKVPISRITWNTEISAATVWQARELLGHAIEQRHALMEPTGLDPPPPQDLQRTPQQASPRAMAHTPPSVGSSSPRPAPFSFGARRNILNRPPAPGRTVGPPPVVVNGTVTPIIASVHSAGLPVISRTLSSSSVENEPALLSRVPFASVRDMSEEDFISGHRASLRRLLRHGGATEVTPSRCVQLKLTPDPAASEEPLRHTQAFARSFLKRVEGLGFGLCDGPKNGNPRHFVFKKKKFSALGDEQKHILVELKVSEVEYNKCFTTAQAHKGQNGVVCLE